MATASGRDNHTSLSADADDDDDDEGGVTITFGDFSGGSDDVDDDSKDAPSAALARKLTDTLQPHHPVSSSLLLLSPPISVAPKYTAPTQPFFSADFHRLTPPSATTTSLAVSTSTSSFVSNSSASSSSVPPWVTAFDPSRVPSRNAPWLQPGERLDDYFNYWFDASTYAAHRRRALAHYDSLPKLSAERAFDA